MSVFTMKYSGLDTKTKAIYGKRLRSEDYKNIINMKSIQEIASYLKKHPGYSDALKESAEYSIHREELEVHLRNELTKEFARILNFTNGYDEKLLYSMVIHLETEDIMYFVRSLISPDRYDFAPRVLPEIERRSEVDFERLKKADNLPDLVEALKGTRYYYTLLPFVKDEVLNYTGIEVALRSQYFKYIMKASEKFVSKSDGKIIRDFLGGQADLTNFNRIIRSKRFFDVRQDSIVANLLPLTYKLDKKIINDMIAAPTWQEAYNLIYGTVYNKLFETREYDMVEQYYYKYILEESKKIMFHCQNSICIPYAYLNVKQIEIKNLITIVESVRYQVNPSAMNRHLIGVTI